MKEKTNDTVKLDKKFRFNWYTHICFPTLQ